MAQNTLAHRNDNEKDIINIYGEMINSFFTQWNSLEVIAILGEKEKRFYGLGMTVILSSDPIDRSSIEIQLDIPHIKIIKFRERSDVFWGLLGSLKEGSIKLANYEIILQGFRFDYGLSRPE